MANKNPACFSKEIEWPKKGLPPFLRKVSFLGKAGKKFALSLTLWKRQARFFRHSTFLTITQQLR